MGVKVRFSLQQFSKVFNVRNSEGLPYVLIGGQAVNYWAERYFQTEPELKTLQPFTSEDIDFKGGKQDVKRIAEQLQLAEVYPSKVAMTALAGCVPFQIGDLKSNIEIVRIVPGISGSIDALERFKKYCSHFGARIFGFWRGFGEGAGLQNPVTEPKRSQNPKRPPPSIVSPEWLQFFLNRSRPEVSSQNYFPCPISRSVANI